MVSPRMRAATPFHRMRGPCKRTRPVVNPCVLAARQMSARSGGLRCHRQARARRCRRGPLCGLRRWRRGQRREAHLALTSQRPFRAHPVRQPRPSLRSGRHQACSLMFCAVRTPNSESCAPPRCQLRPCIVSSSRRRDRPASTDDETLAIVACRGDIRTAWRGQRIRQCRSAARRAGIPWRRGPAKAGQRRAGCLAQRKSRRRGASSKGCSPR